MADFLRERDREIWIAARPYLDVRDNDAHTLISYGIARALLKLRPEADERIVLPAILLHDTGWKFVPADKLAGAIEPKPIHPIPAPARDRGRPRRARGDGPHRRL